jgi:CII-binding regulator of phage lambda lysogenization HflD
MKGIICIVSLCLSWLSNYGQTTIFKGELLSNNSLVKNYTITIDGNPATTNESGVFSTAISSSTTQVEIKASDKSYIVVYPIGGRVLIPKNASLLTQIVLESFQSSGQIKTYMASLSQLKDAAKKGQSETKALQAKIDSMAANLKKLGYSNEDLRIAREKQDGIDLFYPEISGALQNYILQAQSLMIAFKFIGVYAFVNVNALTQYAQTQNAFNQAFEKLYVNYPTYSKRLADYWDDPSLAKTFEGIADTLIYGIGKNKIVPLNDLKNQINQYFQNQIADKDKDKLKKDIQSQIATQVPAIEDQLIAVEQRVKQFLSRLKN